MSKVHPLFVLLVMFCSSLAFVTLNVAAQPDLPVTHEIYSWDHDGKARAFIHIDLPESFDDVEAATIVRVECGDGTVCYHGLLSVVRTENQGAIGTFSLRLSPGVNVLNVYARALDGDGGAVTHTIERFRISVPEPRPLEVEFDGYRISGKNPDHTVNAILDFTLRRPDAWPMPAIRVSLQCQGSVSCDEEYVLIPDWSALSLDLDSDESVTEHHWQASINNLPTVPIRLDATFDVLAGVWSGPSRSAVRRTITVPTDESPDAKVNWRVEEADVQGYYMDGTARVDLSLTADVHNHRHSGESRNPEGRGNGEARVTSVCLFADEMRGEDCQTLPDTTTALMVGNTGASLAVPGLRLPPGDNVLLVNAGDASDHIIVSVAERIVMSRDMWNCFLDTNSTTKIAQLFGSATCGGFSGPRVRKWTLDTVNVYREGDAIYVAMFDRALKSMEEITGIGYEIVEDIESAHIEAYVGHFGHARVHEQLGDFCNRVIHCSHSYSSTNARHTVDRAIISVVYVADLPLGESNPREESLKWLITDQLKQALIPVGRVSRPFLPRLRDPITNLRRHDIPMYRLIYSPKAVPGTMFEDLRDLVEFDDETLDYSPSLPPGDLIIHKMTLDYFEAGSISVNMIGKDLRGAASEPGTRLIVQYSDYSAQESRIIKFSTDNWSSIIFGFDQESWSSAGGRWTMSDEHTGRGRRYRDVLKFDFPLADPTRMVYREIRSAYESDLAVNAQSQFVYRATVPGYNSRWPKPNIEIVIDPETYRMVSYTLEWHFDAEDNVRLPYRVEAEVVEYGAEIEIPDEVREGSAYLANLE